MLAPTANRLSVWARASHTDASMVITTIKMIRLMVSLLTRDQRILPMEPLLRLQVTKVNRSQKILSQFTDEF